MVVQLGKFLYILVQLGTFWYSLVRFERNFENYVTLQTTESLFYARSTPVRDKLTRKKRISSKVHFIDFNIEIIQYCHTALQCYI